MHISEGILTGPSMAATLAMGVLAVGWGATRIQTLVKDQPQRKPLLAMAGAFIFLLSLIPIPAFSGMTTTHPCGTPLAAILLGPGPTIVLSGLTMLLQALFFAHGGLSSLGANTINLGLLGGLSGWMVYRLARRSGLGIFAAGALAGFVGDLMVYVGAGGMLAAHLAFFVEEPKMSLLGYLAVIYAAYVPVQVPIALGEAALTGVALRSIGRQRPEVLEDLQVERKGFAKRAMAGLFVILLAAPLALPAAFTGLDEKVNESLAESGGAPPRDPLINTEAWGDLWNTLLLFSGGVAGFLIGRHWDRLFVRPKPAPKAPRKR